MVIGRINLNVWKFQKQIYPSLGVLLVTEITSNNTGFRVRITDYYRIKLGIELVNMSDLQQCFRQTTTEVRESE